MTPPNPPSETMLLADAFCRDYVPRSSPGKAGLANDALLVQLMKLFGCDHINEYGQFTTVPFITYAARTDAIACMPRVLSHLVELKPSALEIGSLLGGLWRFNCWEDLLTTEEDTRSLAIALVCYTGYYSSVSRVDVAVRENVRDMLNRWLQPATPWVYLPSALEVSRILFGDAWCEIALPDQCDIEPGETTIGQMVARDRPPFMPGICAVQNVDAPADLPVLGA
jgi:hypothetical protein